MHDSSRDAAAALIEGDASNHTAIIRTLRKFGAAALQYALDRNIRVVPLAHGERYQARSEALRRLGVDVDAWPAPPAGLFVVEERTMYLRSRSTMTVAHEFSHALDCALGDGVYRSSIDPVLRRLFSGASAFITPYAATGIDEYFAESLRAYIEANDSQSFWPRATRERLRRIDPEMYVYVDGLFKVTFRAAA